MPGYIIDMGVMCEPDSREPWFISSAHDAKCLEETLGKFEERRIRVRHQFPGTAA